LEKKLKNDKYFLDLAYKEAEKAFKKGEVPVGAVIVCNGKVISKAHNLRQTKKNPLYHAEILAIQKASKKLKSWRLDDCVLYITLEPCLMCAGVIMQSRIKKVIFSAEDKKAGVVLNNFKVFDEKNLPFKIEYNFIPDEKAVNILKEFFKEKRNEKNNNIDNDINTIFYTSKRDKKS